MISQISMPNIHLDYWPIKKGNGNKYNLLFLNGIYLVHFYKRHLQYKINPVYWTNDEQHQQLSFYLYGNLSLGPADSS